MKIALVSAEFPPEKGGVQTYAWHFANALAGLGHKITVFTTPHPEGEATSDAFTISPSLQLRRRLDRRALLRERFDVWHVLNAAYAWLARETAPVFVTVHGNDFLSPYQPVARLDLRERWSLPWGSRADRWLGDILTRSLVRRSLPAADCIFTNSRFTEQRLCDLLPACRGKTSAAMVGVDKDYFSAGRGLRTPGPPRLITVCRLAERHKNVDVVLRALRLLSSSAEFHYTVVGDGWQRPELEALAQELGLASRVTFTGFLDQGKLQQLLLESDLFVLPTSATPVAYEGFGLVYLEANACGCPVLAARIGGAVEAVSEGESGFFVDTVTADSVAAALQRFLEGGVVFDSAACRAFAQGFSWQRVAEHCVFRYQASLARRGEEAAMKS